MKLERGHVNWYEELTFKCSLLLKALEIDKNIKILAKIKQNANIEGSYCEQFVTSLGFLADSLVLKNKKIDIKKEQLAQLRDLLEKI